jgi:phosphoenolpyruvate carboxykinase (GTP)
MNSWIEKMEALCEPDRVHFCDGSAEDRQTLCQTLIDHKLFTPLKRPNSYCCHSTTSDVARVEASTYICTQKEEDAGPTNHWRDPQEMHRHLHTLFKGCMRGRTLYVVPFLMGHIGSPLSRRGIQLTDSPYAALSMQIMTRVKPEFLKEPFIPCMHSVGVPLTKGQKDVPWPCNPEKRVIVHFPEEPSIWSFGSGYGGNALLGKKCVALRIASFMGKKQGWIAEHMLIIGVENPEGEKRYFAAAFPSACGKTNLAMLKSPLPGWKVTCIGDDIAWMHIGADGRLYALNPEYGFFGVAPGTSMATNPYAMQVIEKNTIFTNVAHTPDGEVWWEGMTPNPPPHLIDWQGQPWTPQSKTPAAHPNARFTAPLSQCPILDPEWENPQGVPISAILFGGRRANLIPLVSEANSWEQGVLFGASLSSERTAAAEGAIGSVRRDPFAMLPFCGYNMGDYFGHWLDIGKKAAKLPRIYQVNWFAKDSSGKYLWPGFGQNMRVLKWVFERCSGKASAKEGAFGLIPETLDLQGLNLAPGAFEALFHVDPAAYQAERKDVEVYLHSLGTRVPEVLYKLLRERSL